MMSSVDLSTSGRGPHASAQQIAASNARYNAHNMRYTAPPPRASGSSTGRAKTEQVVLEFLYKAAELIVQSRVNLQAEPDLRRGSRRARFNLDIDEVQAVREAMAAWKEDVRLPLAIDVFWDAGDGHKLLLERWSVTFAADGEGAGALLGSTQDVIQQLKEVCKRISVLLRALFSFMRQLPAHRLFAQSYPSMLSYAMHAAPASDATRAFEAVRVATSGYSFIPIATPFGLLKIAAVYRRDCDQFMERQEQAAPSRIFHDNYIIQDYVPGSPELVPASAPVPSRTSAAMADAPMRVTDLRSDSFVPVSDAEQFGGNVGGLQRRRSSPRSIPTSAVTPQQQFSSTGPLGDSGADDDVVVRTQPGMSKPMAIPRVSSKGGMAAAGGREGDAATGYGDEQSDGKIIQHAHSYGGEDEVRLRGAAANPNVTAAPYGYGNVAIEREQQHTSSPSLAFQQRQQQLWEGGATHQDAESGLHVSQTSFHDEPPTSNSNAAYHRLSTPPRHPKSISLLRTGRTSPALTHKPFLPGNEIQHTPGSLDNFTLDSGSPSPAQLHVPRRRKSSFNGAFVSDSSIGSPNEAFTGAPEGVQEDLQTKSAAVAVDATTKTEVIAIRPGGSKHPPTDGIPMFSSSPPFQANPCELLSTSPGYSYSKNYLRSGSSNVPTFITTDQFQLGLHGAKRSSFSSSAGLISAKKRGFSPDFSDSGVTAWGISPDTPDAFGLAIVDATGSSSGGRPRFLSLSGSVDAGGASSDGQSDDLDADSTDMILPFAIGERSSIGSSATTAADSVSTGISSTLNRSSGASLDTASVGSFLHQIKNAPRLSKFASALTPSAPDRQLDKTSDDKPTAPAPTSIFDDELAGFRSLRDELARVL